MSDVVSSTQRTEIVTALVASYTSIAAQLVDEFDIGNKHSKLKKLKEIREEIVYWGGESAAETLNGQQILADLHGAGPR